MYAVADGLYIDESGDYVALNTTGLSSVAALANTDPSITSVTYVADEGEVEVPVVRGDSVNALDTALAQSNVVVLTDGDYKIDNAHNKNVTIVGTADTIINATKEGSEGCDYGLEGSTVTFEGVTINTVGQGDAAGYARTKATYNNCTFIGAWRVYDNSVFNNCKFDTQNGYVWATWGATKVDFNNCTFESDVAKAILLHGGYTSVVTVKDCTFIAKTAAYTWDGLYVAAVSMDPSGTDNTYTVNFEGTNTVKTADGATADTYGKTGYAGLHQVKYENESSRITVTENGNAVANNIAVKVK